MTFHDALLTPSERANPVTGIGTVSQAEDEKGAPWSPFEPSPSA